MKAKILVLTLVAALAVSFGAKAQGGHQHNECCKSAHDLVFDRDNKSAHWFLDLEGGIGFLPFGYDNNQVDFKDRLSITPFLGIGKWHNPWMASRLQFNAWELKGFEDAGAKAFKNYYGMAHYQFIFDVVSYFENYCPKRFMRFAPFVGAGVAYRFKTVDAENNKVIPGYGNIFMDKVSGSVNAGLMFRFRLCRWVDLNLEAQMMVNNVNFAGSLPRRDAADFSAFVTAGLGFNLGKPEWDVVTPMDWNLVNDLNQQINILRTENIELNKRPVSCPECPEAAVKHCSKCPQPNGHYTTKRTVRDVVYFRINKWYISKPQYRNIEKMANYSKEFNAKIYIVGYADENTGTAPGNMILSENRVNAVAKVLMDKYGIAPEMIIKEFKGDTVQPFETPEWNRAVVMTIAEE